MPEGGAPHLERASTIAITPLFCTLWQILTADATFVTNPARVLGAHSAPAVVRCARCVSPTHTALCLTSNANFARPTSCCAGGGLS